MNKTALLVGGAAAGAAGGLLSYFANMSAADRARELQDTALQQFIGLRIPDPNAQKLALQRFVQTGELTPEFEQAIKQSPSEFQKIVASSANKASQNRALAQLEDIGNEGGLRLQDKAALQDAELHAQVQDRGARNAIQDDMARKGLGGSGFDLQAQLQGQQAAGDRASRGALDVAAKAQDRALQSIEDSGDLATKYRTQDFSEQAQRAQAQDAINKFNAANLQDVQHANTGLANRAQEMNLSERQRVADKNVDTSNAEQKYNKGLLQNQFDNQLNIAKSKSGIYQDEAQGEINKGQTTGNLFSNLGDTASGVASSLAANASGAPKAAATASSFWDDYFDKQKKQKAGAFGGQTNI